MAVRQYEPAVTENILVIGSGPAGMRFVDELLRRRSTARVHLFSNEPFQPYNRVLLSSLLSGDRTPEQIELPFPDLSDYPNFTYSTATICDIDTGGQTVGDSLGRRFAYDKLVIATGARAHVPSIDGVQRQGVYTFRNMKDAHALYSRVARARHLVIVGGGVLGLEAARGLSRLSTRVTVIQQGERLMNRQLDDPAAALLMQKVRALGIEVITNSGVREVLGNGRVTAIRTRDGQVLACDTVLLCAGIRPNMELARSARLKVATGILVNDSLQTSDPHVYAIGECCEHRGKTYGLVSPGLEQAAVAAEAVAGGNACYQGSTTVSRLKVIGEDVVSIGDVNDLPQRPAQREITFRHRRQQKYRKLVLHKGRLIGAVGFGPWAEFRRIEESYKSGRRIWPWQWLMFWVLGRLWLLQGAGDVSRWPLSSIICQCNQIALQDLKQAQADGCSSVDALGEATRAGTVCGSCRPMLSQILGTRLERARAWPFLLAGSFMAVVAALIMMFLPAAQVSESVQAVGWFERIWNDKDWKQVSGFSLLGLVLIGLLMSLRKRLGWTWMGAFFGWRLLHVALGTVSAGLLMLHTGFHLGENLNRLLMTSFLVVLVFGGLAGGVAGLAHKLAPAQAAGIQKGWNYLHILVAWPLPVLLIAHIITVYYF
jgi:nitrite reductase (NADH) large subunit